MKYTVGFLTVARMREEGQELLEEHYQELTLHKEVVKLEVDWDGYQQLEDKGTLASIGLWEEDRLIGYSVFIVVNHIHYKGLKVGNNDVIFLTPGKRKGRLGIVLIKQSERLLKILGVHKVLFHCKYDTVIGPLLKKMGYGDEEYTVGKLL